VFDYLLDDHDRKFVHNWLGTHEQGILLWDNGLAFKHGPVSMPECLDILCGISQWTRHLLSKENGTASRDELSDGDVGEEADDDGTAPSQPCARICVFNPAMVALLKSIGPDAPRDRQLGRRLEDALARESSPGFEWMNYIANSRQVHYSSPAFFEGMQIKIQRLLAHVDACVVQYGEQRVLPNARNSSTDG